MKVMFGVTYCLRFLGSLVPTVSLSASAEKIPIFGKMWSVPGSNPVGAAGLVGAISFRIDRGFSFRCFRNVDMQE